MSQKQVILIGYSGHAFVVTGIFQSMGRSVTGYCDSVEKDYNPFKLLYLGKESSPEARVALGEKDFFVAIGDNHIRRKVTETLAPHHFIPVNAVHTSAIIDPSARLGSGVMVAARAVLNPLAAISDGVICNTGCIIEHECIVDSFAHIGPGTVLCGNVKVGVNSFVGAGAVVRQGITIGNNVIVGAGAVVVKDVPDNSIVMGNPSRLK